MLPETGKGRQTSIHSPVHARVHGPGFEVSQLAMAFRKQSHLQFNQSSQGSGGTEASTSIPVKFEEVTYNSVSLVSIVSKDDL